MKALNIVLRVVLGLLIISPILGVTGLFPAPTADMYNTADAFTFIDIMMKGGYITWIMAIVFAFTLYLIITNRMALAALLILPITVNIVGFHAFLDGGLFTAGAVMGNVLLLINAYFLWQNWSHYKSLWNKSSVAAVQSQA
ncbi:MAG TPA: hypothetical protein VGE35_03965 [Candidatus Paceibacterota bacterium]